MPDSTGSEPKNNGLATASLTLGILATVLGVIGIGAILGILAIVFGAVSIKNNKSKSLAGIITGVIGIIIVIATAYFIFSVIPKANEDLQASQRDTQRKNDLSVLSSDIIYHTSESRGVLPESDYVNSMTYKLAIIKGAVNGDSSAKLSTSQAVYIKGIDCNGNTGLRNYSLKILLENGETHCEDS